MHARPNADLEQILDQMMRTGLPHKILTIRPYRESADLPRDDHYIQCATATRPASSASFVPTSRDHLEASTALGAGYDASAAEEAVQLIYEAAETWRHSLQVLLAHNDVRAAVKALRADGWLDWHILGELMTMALRWRIDGLGIDIETLEPADHPDLATRPETASDPRMPDDSASTI